MTTIRLLAAALLLVLGLAASPASAQSGCSNIATGAVLTAAQWQACFQKKIDFPIAAPLSIPGLTVTGSFTATGLVTNADLANPSVVINGVGCTLGSSCAGITATATSITPDTTGVVGGVDGDLLAVQSATLRQVTSTFTISGTACTIGSVANCIPPLKIASGNTVVSGGETIPGGTGSGVFLYYDANNQLQAGGLYFNGAGPDILINLSTLALNALPASFGGGLKIIGGAPTLTMYGYGSNGNGAQIIGTAAEGTYTSPSTLLDTDVMTQLWGMGYSGGTNWGGSPFGIGAIISFNATQDWSTTANGTQFIFYIVPNNLTYFTATSANKIIAGTWDWQIGLHVNTPLVLDGATPSTSTGVSLGSTTVAASNCGSLAGAAGCLKIAVAGAGNRYIPYY